MRALKPLPRRNSSTGRIAFGATWSAAFSRKNSVSATLSESCSRSSRARSSRPVASGTRGVSGGKDVHRGGRLDGPRGQLLRALRVVALAPAQRRVLEDLGAQLEDPVDERLGAGRGGGGEAGGRA